MFRSTANLMFAVLTAGCVITSAQQDPLPEFYGVYALQGGKLTELLANSDQNDFGPTVRFVVFSKAVALAEGGIKIFFIPPQQRRDTQSNEFKGWDDFWRQSQQFNTAMEKYIQYEVPANAVEIPFRVGPYGGNSEMVRVVPSRDFPPGLYQLAKGARFWVRRDEVKSMYTESAATQQGGRNTAAPPAATRKSLIDPESVPAVSSRQGGTITTTTRVGIRNKTFRPIQLFMDGSETPIIVRAGGYTAQLEVGSKHLIKVVVGSRTFQAEFTVPSAMWRSIIITANGIEIP